MKCPNCSTYLYEGTVICRACQHPTGVPDPLETVLQTKAVCVACAERIDKGVEFCSICGICQSDPQLRRCLNCQHSPIYTGASACPTCQMPFARGVETRAYVWRAGEAQPTERPAVETRAYVWRAGEAQPAGRLASEDCFACEGRGTQLPWWADDPLPCSSCEGNGKILVLTGSRSHSQPE